MQHIVTYTSQKCPSHSAKAPAAHYNVVCFFLVCCLTNYFSWFAKFCNQFEVVLFCMEANLSMLLAHGKVNKEQKQTNPVIKISWFCNRTVRSIIRTIIIYIDDSKSIRKLLRRHFKTHTSHKHSCGHSKFNYSLCAQCRVWLFSGFGCCNLYFIIVFTTPLLVVCCYFFVMSIKFIAIIIIVPVGNTDQ